MDTILVVDDEVNYLILMKDLLGKAGYKVITARSAIEALKIVGASDIDLVLADMKMSKMSSIELLDDLHRLYPDLPVIIMTAFGTVKKAVTAIKKGAFDYILKPFRDDEILETIAEAIEQRHLILKNILLNQEREKKYGFPNIVVESRSMQEVMALVKRVAQSRATVLITGESSTGKELVARTIHLCSQRAQKSFVSVNCLLTSAVKMRDAISELADGGTLFMNEVAEMSQDLQVELLGMLQKMDFERVGVDVQVVAASNRDLKGKVEAGRFREDLYYRLNVFPICLPPLRERMADIPALSEHFLTKYAEEHAKPVQRLSAPALDLLMQYPWPGNVRELENIIERAVLVCDEDTILTVHLPPTLQRQEPGWGRPRGLSTQVEHLERELIAEALRQTRGNQSQAAQILDISLRILGYKIKQYGIEVRSFRGA